MENDSLYHHGIIGQKWGVRRFQNKDGSLTSEGAKRYGDNTKSLTLKVGSKSSKEARKAEKEKQRKAAEKEKQKKAAEKAKQTEADKAKLKEQIMAKGDYKGALDNIEMFSNADLKNLVDRRTQMNSLSAFQTREKSKIRRGAEKATEILNTIGNLGSATIKVYNNTAGFVNLFKEGIHDDSGKMRKISGGKDK